MTLPDDKTPKDMEKKDFDINLNFDVVIINDEHRTRYVFQFNTVHKEEKDDVFGLGW
jgi:hypothetical protein